MPAKLRPALVIGTVALVWGSVGTIVRQVPLPAAAIAAGRVWVAAIALGALLATGNVAGPALFSRCRVRLVAMGVILAGHWIALFAAYQRMPVSRAIFVVYLGPVLMAALATRVLGEHHDRRTLLALGVALLGFAILAAPSLTRTGRATTLSGLVFAVIAALSFAAMVLVTKPAAEIYGGIRAAFMQLLIAGVVLMPVAATQRWGSPQRSWWWLVVLGVVHTAAALAAYSGALARLPVATVGTLVYVEPVAAACCAWLVLHERPSWGFAGGAALVLGAGYVVVAAARSAGGPAEGGPAEGGLAVTADAAAGVAA